MGRATEAFRLLIVKKFPTRREIHAIYPSLSEEDIEGIKIKRRASGRSNKVEQELR